MHCASLCHVENEATFHELCSLRCGDLFVFTSYANRATELFLKKLPREIPRYHFGDTDPHGFDVLRSLRIKLDPITVAPLHMGFKPTDAAKPLSDHEKAILARLLTNSRLTDLRPELEAMQTAGTKGDFEQERLAVSGGFPYRDGSRAPSGAQT